MEREIERVRKRIHCTKHITNNKKYLEENLAQKGREGLCYNYTMYVCYNVYVICYNYTIYYTICFKRVVRIPANSISI